MTLMYTVVAVEGSGNRGTAIFRTRYPDDSRWWTVPLYEADGDHISHSQVFFAPEFEAPEWRAHSARRHKGTEKSRSVPARLSRIPAVSRAALWIMPPKRLPVAYCGLHSPCPLVNSTCQIARPDGVELLTGSLMHRLA